ncbi:MAG TPA: SDR family oxidoreductase [Acidimicrobiales bacterium]|jgi:retinol dehydrogenase-13|nr:SDR family oxidoreductase [Acidimicrobiales bacterium]
MDLSDLRSSTMLVTGGNTGIGLETAVGLAGTGARVVITSRSADRGARALDTIRTRSGSERVDVMPLDLGSFASIRTFAAAFLARYDRLDVLINNAGLAPAGHRRETAEGFEAAFGVNHLGHFLLTRLLLDRIVASAPARIVVVSSGAYRAAPDGICFDDLQHKDDFHSFRVYGESKLANIYFMLELARQLAGTGVSVNALNPGYVATELGKRRPEDGPAPGPRPAEPRTTGAARVLDNLPPPMPAAEGARTSIQLATSPTFEGVTGAYFNEGVREPLDPIARDADAAQRLWLESERLIASYPA